MEFKEVWSEQNDTTRTLKVTIVNVDEQQLMDLIIENQTFLLENKDAFEKWVEEHKK